MFNFFQSVIITLGFEMVCEYSNIHYRLYIIHGRKGFLSIRYVILYQKRKLLYVAFSFAYSYFLFDNEIEKNFN